MSLVNEKKKGYNQLVLRSIDMVCTILAIASHTVAPTFRFFGYLEWIAFPIFAYLLAEGVENSMARGLYAVRLFLFAVLSEVPYDLMMSGKVMDTRQQNVLFTLFFGYLILLGVDLIRTHADNLILTIDDCAATASAQASAAEVSAWRAETAAGAAASSAEQAGTLMGGGYAVSERHLYLEMHGSKRRTDVCVGCAVINNGKQNKTPRRFSGGFPLGV